MKTHKRLLASGIETPKIYQRLKLEEKNVDILDDVDWPLRLKNHCRYLVADRLRGKDVYEMWLRTSAASYQDFATFESFFMFRRIRLWRLR